MNGLSEGNKYLLSELAKNLSELTAMSWFSIEQLGKRYDGRTDWITEREIFLDSSADLTLPFLQIYAQVLESKTFTELKEYEKDGRKRYAKELVRTYSLLRDVVNNLGDENLASHYDQKIVLIGDKANNTRPEYDEGINPHINLELTLLAYDLAKQDTTERKLQTAEGIFDYWKKSQIFINDDAIKSIYSSMKEEQSERISKTLNEMFTNSENIFDSYNHPRNIETLVDIATTIAKENPTLYKALEQYLDNKLKAEVKYPGTEIFTGSEVSFKPVENPLEILGLVPEDWDLLMIEFENPQAIPKTSNKIVNRVPLNLGFESKEQKETYDRNRTQELIQSDGRVYERYYLAADTPEELQKIKDELIPVLLEKDYRLSWMSVGRIKSYISKSNLEKAHTWDINGTILKFAYHEDRATKTRTPSTVNLTTTRHFTTAEEVEIFTKNLELIVQEER